MKNITLMIILLTNSIFAQKYFDDLIPSDHPSQGWGNNSDYSFELNDISRNSWDPLHVWGTNSDQGPVLVVSRNDTCIFPIGNSLLMIVCKYD